MTTIWRLQKTFLHPSKSNATRIWSIKFILSLICIHQVRYLWKACLFAFRLMPYLLGLFYWGVCRLSKLRATSKMKGCKIDRIEWEIHVITSFGVSYCECMHEYQGRTQRGVRGAVAPQKCSKQETKKQQKTQILDFQTVLSVNQKIMQLK